MIWQRQPCEEKNILSTQGHMWDCRFNQILSWRIDILRVRNLPQPLQANYATMHQRRSHPLPSMSSPIHYSLINLLFGPMQSQQIAASFSSLQINIQITLHYDDRNVYTRTMFKRTLGNILWWQINLYAFVSLQHLFLAEEQAVMPGNLITNRCAHSLPFDTINPWKPSD